MFNICTRSENVLLAFLFVILAYVAGSPSPVDNDDVPYDRRQYNGYGTDDNYDRRQYNGYGKQDYDRRQYNGYGKEISK
ncbi:hypothetical protein Avbf_12619 [Armadillidium vulgare]|nr:hypothetical protein Avbf_12619 [Armadillidium vulgare]